MIHNDFTRLKGRIEALKNAGTFEKASIAEGILDETVRVMEAQANQIDLLITRLDGMQHGRGAQ